MSAEQTITPVGGVVAGKSLGKTPTMRLALAGGRVTALMLAGAVSLSLLVAVFLSVVNSVFGYAAFENDLEPGTLKPGASGVDDFDRSELERALDEHLSSGLLRRLESETPLAERSTGELRDLVLERVINPSVVESWSLAQSIFERELIVAYGVENPSAEIRFHSWLSWRFLSEQQSTDPLDAGILSAILGTVWTISIALLVAMPIGVATGVYLSEYARSGPVASLIHLNIQNLAAIPPVIYGLLGLALFVRVGAPVTTGAIFGAQPTSDGRTILAAGLTLGVLVLPVVVVNAHAAMESIPDDYRRACEAVGASRSQIVFLRLVPFALDRLLTVTILAISRVIGETTPLIIVGAATVMAVSPSGPFSRFTALPAQIYYWSFNPTPEFQRLAAAAILVLLVISLTLNILLVVLRRRIQLRKG